MKEETILKGKCKECGWKGEINPYYDDWFCPKCHTHWVLFFEDKEETNKWQ